jgi:hypothetical protein
LNATLGTNVSTVRLTDHEAAPATAGPVTLPSWTTMRASMPAIIGRLNVMTIELEVLTPVDAAVGDTERRYTGSSDEVASAAHPIRKTAASALLELRTFRMLRLRNDCGHHTDRVLL